MTALYHNRATAMSRPRKSLNWKQIERTIHRPGEWRQTPQGFERVTQ